MELLRTELPRALRRLIRSPWFAAASVLLLALGIGAATAIFSVVTAVLLEPIVPAQEELFVVHEAKPEDATRPNEISLPQFLDWRDQSRSFRTMAAFNPTLARVTLFTKDDPISVQAGQVTPGFFEVLEVEPILGRVFRGGEDEPEASRVVVLSYGFWQEVLS